MGALRSSSHQWFPSSHAEARRVLRQRALPCGERRPLVRSACALLAVAGAWGTGCSQAMVQGLRQDRSFTYESVSEGGIGIVGVTWLAAFDTSGTPSQAQLASALRTQMLEVRPELDVVSASAIATSLGADAYARVLALHEQTGELDSAALAELGTRLEVVRYIVVASIEHEAVDSTRGEQTDSSGTSVTLRTSRRLDVGLRVYDLRPGLAAWSGRITNTESTERTYQEGGGGIVEQLVEAVVTIALNLRAHPPPPSRLDVLEGTFKTFARHLPKPPRAR